jgi:hypothetical protein
MKNDISNAIFDSLSPIQEKRKKLETEFNLEEMITAHTKICRDVASATLTETKQKMGLL